MACLGHRSGVIETKLVLTRRTIFEAAGQVLIYRAAIDPNAEAIVAGFARVLPITATTALATLGVKVLAFAPPDIQDDRQLVRLPRSTPGLQSITLRWNVQMFARSQGVVTVPQLATLTGIPKQTLYAIWRGEAVQVSLDVLGRVCSGLNARPGDWFLWQSGPDNQRLIWNIACLAGGVGLTAAQLAFKAGIYYRMSQLYWLGTAQSTSITTLAKLANTFIAEDITFDLGDLFTWREAQS